MTADMSLTLVYPPTCRWNTPAGRCGKPSRPYACGHRCDEHSPWGLAGTPEPLTPTEIQQRKEGATPQ